MILCVQFRGQISYTDLILRSTELEEKATCRCLHISVILLIGVGQCSQSLAGLPPPLFTPPFVHCLYNILKDTFAVVTSTLW